MGGCKAWASGFECRACRTQKANKVSKQTRMIVKRGTSSLAPKVKHVCLSCVPNLELDCSERPWSCKGRKKMSKQFEWSFLQASGY